LESELNKPGINSSDVWTSVFSASIDLLALAYAAEVATVAAAAAPNFVLAVAAAIPGVASIPVVVPILAGVGAALLVNKVYDNFWDTTIKPHFIESYKALVPAPTTITPLSGHAVDGPIAGATVFSDSNYNGVFDAGERSTTTDQNGAFTLNAGVGPVIVMGGRDTLTDLPFRGKLVLHEDASVITPLTTLVSILRDHGDLNANAHILEAFGLYSLLALELMNSQ
jgi:hypothetical protein